MEVNNFKATFLMEGTLLHDLLLFRKKYDPEKNKFEKDNISYIKIDKFYLINNYLSFCKFINDYKNEKIGEIRESEDGHKKIKYILCIYIDGKDFTVPFKVKGKSIEIKKKLFKNLIKLHTNMTNSNKLYVDNTINFYKNMLDYMLLLIEKKEMDAGDIEKYKKASDIDIFKRKIINSNNKKIIKRLNKLPDTEYTEVNDPMTESYVNYNCFFAMNFLRCLYNKKKFSYMKYEYIERVYNMLIKVDIVLTLIYDEYRRKYGINKEFLDQQYKIMIEKLLRKTEEFAESTNNNLFRRFENILNKTDQFNLEKQDRQYYSTLDRIMIDFLTITDFKLIEPKIQKGGNGFSQLTKRVNEVLSMEVLEDKSKIIDNQYRLDIISDLYNRDNSINGYGLTAMNNCAFYRNSIKKSTKFSELYDLINGKNRTMFAIRLDIKILNQAKLLEQAKKRKSQKEKKERENEDEDEDEEIEEEDQEVIDEYENLEQSSDSDNEDDEDENQKNSFINYFNKHERNKKYGISLNEKEISEIKEDDYIFKIESPNFEMSKNGYYIIDDMKKLLHVYLYEQGEFDKYIFVNRVNPLRIFEIPFREIRDGDKHILVFKKKYDEFLRMIDGEKDEDLETLEYFDYIINSYRKTFIDDIEDEDEYDFQVKIDVNDIYFNNIIRSKMRFMQTSEDDSQKKHDVFFGKYIFMELLQNPNTRRNSNQMKLMFKLFLLKEVLDVLFIYKEFKNLYGNDDNETRKNITYYSNIMDNIVTGTSNIKGLYESIFPDGEYKEDSYEAEATKYLILFFGKDRETIVQRLKFYYERFDKIIQKTNYYEYSQHSNPFPDISQTPDELLFYYGLIRDRDNPMKPIPEFQIYPYIYYYKGLFLIHDTESLIQIMNAALIDNVSYDNVLSIVWDEDISSPFNIIEDGKVKKLVFSNKHMLFIRSFCEIPYPENENYDLDLIINNRSFIMAFNIYMICIMILYKSKNELKGLVDKNVFGGAEERFYNNYKQKMDDYKDLILTHEGDLKIEKYYYQNIMNLILRKFKYLKDAFRIDGDFMHYILINMFSDEGDTNEYEKKLLDYINHHEVDLKKYVNKTIKLEEDDLIYSIDEKTLENENLKDTMIVSYDENLLKLISDYVYHFIKRDDIYVDEEEFKKFNEIDEPFYKTKEAIEIELDINSLYYLATFIDKMSNDNIYFISIKGDEKEEDEQAEINFLIPVKSKSEITRTDLGIEGFKGFYSPFEFGESFEELTAKKRKIEEPKKPKIKKIKNVENEPMMVFITKYLRDMVLQVNINKFLIKVL